MIDQLFERFQPGFIFGVLCVVFLLFAPLIWVRYLATKPPTIRFSSLAFVKRVSPSFVTRIRWIVPFIRICAILALVFALARPKMGGEVAESREGIAIQMVLDVSGSMSDQDFVIDGKRVRRIDAVKKVFRDFVLGTDRLPGRPNDLIGMTTFAYYADTRCPLTLDHANLAELLRATEIPGWINGQQRWEHPESMHTSLGSAITLATHELRRAGEQARLGLPGAEAAKSKVMILLTDGSDNPPREFRESVPNPVEAAKLAAKFDIKIYTIGAIGQTRMLPGFGRTDRVDEPTLKRIASTTGGAYFRAMDTRSLTQIYEQIDKLERQATGDRAYRDDTQAARYAMLIGLGLLFFEVLLINTRFRTVP